MRLPKTSRVGGTPMLEIILGKGDYAAGGAHTAPFLDLDGARRRRPLVFGEVWASLDDYPAVAAEMFSGRQNDVSDWAMMWKEIEADGVCLRLGDDPQEALSMVSEVSRRTSLPIMVSVSGNHEAVYRTIGKTVKDTVLIFLCPDSVVSASMAEDCRGHVISIPAEERKGVVSGMGGTMIMLHSECVFCEEAGGAMSVLCDVRTEGISGEPDSRSPLICDVTGAWNIGEPKEFLTSLLEGESALMAMLCGADVLIVRGPGAADMARVYGEELADL